jgi:hypothetical protein
MADFTEVAEALKGTPDLERSLRALGFRCVEELSPKLPREGETSADYSSEIWVRKLPDEYQAVRIDWQGHPTVPTHFAGHPAHVHFESFPLSEFGNYLIGPAKGVQRFDTTTGKPSADFGATHGKVRVVP